MTIIQNDTQESALSEGHEKTLLAQGRDKIIKTEIRKHFEWGFFLTEAELRRIVRTCIDFTEKIPQVTFDLTIEVKLRDGSHLVCKTPEDVLSIENGGRRTVRELQIKTADRSQNPDWLIEVNFQDGADNPRSWTSADFRIVGQDRDWAFLTATEIEERLLRTKKISLPRLASSRWLLPIVSMIPFIIFFAMISGLTSTHIVDKLEKLRREGQITDPIDAMIFIERSKAAAGGWRFFGSLIAALLGIALLFSFFLYFLPKILPGYVFYWGDVVPHYDRRVSIVKIVWVTIILGAFASILGGLILSYILK